MAAYETKRYTITGTTGLIVHNGQLANPLHPIVKQMKKITAKKKKTEEDHEELARLEWYGSLYLGDKGEPVMPGECLEALIRSGAKKTRQGKDVQSSVLVDGLIPIQYEGPKNIDKLWAMGDKFAISVPVKVVSAKVIRTRPIFRSWKLTFDVKFGPDVIDVADLDGFIVTAGEMCGLCDWRPRYGRFEVTEAKLLSESKGSLVGAA